MASEIKTFGSISEFLKYLDEQLGSLRKQLGELLRVLEDVRIRAEQDKRLRALLERLGARAAGVTEARPVVELQGIRIAFNPTAEVEQEVLEQLVENINEKIARLQAIRKSLEALAAEDIEAQVNVVIIDDIPRALLIKV